MGAKTELFIIYKLCLCAFDMKSRIKKKILMILLWYTGILMLSPSIHNYDFLKVRRNMIDIASNHAKYKDAVKIIDSKNWYYYTPRIVKKNDMEWIMIASPKKEKLSLKVIFYKIVFLYEIRNYGPTFSIESGDSDVIIVNNNST